MHDHRFPPVGLGTGGAEPLSGDDCVDAVATAIELGYRHIDTAVLYRNHEFVGRGIEAADVPREELTVATKIPPADLGYRDLLDRMEQSLSELGLDRIDVGYVHFPTQAYDPEETFAALDELVDDGTVLNIGVSNFSVDQVREARDVADKPIVANQVELHPLWDQPELVDFADENDMTIVAYSPFARGNVLTHETIRDIADEHGTSPARISLSWITQKRNVVAVARSTNEAHLEENLRSPFPSLTDEDVARIGSIPERERVVDVSAYE